MDISSKGPSWDLNELSLDTASKMPTHSDNPVVDEFKRMAKTALWQILGRTSQPGSGQAADYSETDIKKMKDSDDQFSEREYLELRRKIQAIYDEYRLRKAREKEEKEREEEEKQAQKLAKLYEVRQSGNAINVNTAVSKGSAETGRNWGAE